MRILVDEFDKFGQYMAGDKTVIIEQDKYAKLELKFVKGDEGYTCHMTDELMDLIMKNQPWGL